LCNNKLLESRKAEGMNQFPLLAVGTLFYTSWRYQPNPLFLRPS